MGTNYYLTIEICKYCHSTQTYHIGKSSAGWKFLFQKITGKAENYDQWVSFLKQGKITDEYGRELTLEEFVELVQSKQCERSQYYTDMGMVGNYNFMSGDFS